MRWYIALLVCGITGCTPSLQGPDVDLAIIASPDPPKGIPAPAMPKPAPGPTPTAGFFRAWIPRQTAPNGDTTDGHFITVSTTPPALQVLEPAHPIPRPPRTKEPKAKPPVVQVPVSQLPPGTLPPGMSWGVPSSEGGR